MMHKDFLVSPEQFCLFGNTLATEFACFSEVKDSVQSVGRSSLNLVSFLTGSFLFERPALSPWGSSYKSCAVIYFLLAFLEGLLQLFVL